MSFGPYHGDMHSLEVEEGEVYAVIKGSESYQSGEYMNSRNRTIRVKLPTEEVLNAADELADADTDDDGGASA